MLFSSPEFLFVFLPLFLGLYFAVPDRFRNLTLFLGSLFFYFTVAGSFVLLLVASVLFNFYVALRIEANRDDRRKAWLAAGVVLNLLPLLYYKYTGFMLNSLAALFPFLVRADYSGLAPLLPSGISFFTFQAISYLVDAYRREIKPAGSLTDFGMYHACFPQLIAGPIVRYEEIDKQIARRKVKLNDVAEGALRFCLGLGKKVILADTMGQVANAVFALKADQLDTLTAWMGIIAYSLQILYDFSGYSDMAIGIGRMFSFRFPENFNHPYQAASITEFWQRWHMTLARWFRDYVYIPMGGNRAGDAKTIRNLFAVFVLCGLWHGANYTFLVWGLYHGTLLGIERLRRRFAPRFAAPVWGGRIYMSVAVMFGWVIFRSGDLAQAAHYLATLIDLSQLHLTQQVITLMTFDKITYLVIGLLIALAPVPKMANQTWDKLRYPAGIMVLLVSVVMLSANGFNPFIYFRF